VTWHDGFMQGFDTETTGVDFETDRIVTISLVECGPTGSITRGQLLNPGVEIAPGATEVHGITNEMAQKDGAPPAEVIAEYVELLRKGQQEGLPLVAYNARFDLTLLDRECRRYGIEPLKDPLVVDPRVIDAWLDRFRRGSRKLQAVCRHHRVPMTDWHTSDADALAACRLAWVLAKRGVVTRRATLSADRRVLAEMQDFWTAARDDLEMLHTAQRTWADEQAVGLAEHFKRKGQSDWEKVLSQRAWPIVPVTGDGQDGEVHAR